MLYFSSTPIIMFFGAVATTSELHHQSSTSNSFLWLLSHYNLPLLGNVPANPSSFMYKWPRNYPIHSTNHCWEPPSFLHRFFHHPRIVHQRRCGMLLFSAAATPVPLSILRAGTHFLQHLPLFSYANISPATATAATTTIPAVTVSIAATATTRQQKEKENLYSPSK